jgi:hypothetical protein
MERHGIPHPEVTVAARGQELPGSVLGLHGTSVPSGVSRARFEAALSACGAGFQRFGVVPITSKVIRHRISQVVACLARNGHGTVTANFSNPGALILTPGVNTESARWVATLRGCEVSTKLVYRGPPLDEAALNRCMGSQALAGTSTSSPAFRLRLAELQTCLERR